MFAQGIVNDKFQELSAMMESLLTTVVESARTGCDAHEIERDVFRRVLAMGREVMQVLFELVGPGDLGETVRLPDGERDLRRLDLQTRPYESVFGEFQVTRYVYAVREGQKIELVPTDQHLGLPESAFSYLLQQWDQALGPIP